MNSKLLPPLKYLNRLIWNRLRWSTPNHFLIILHGFKFFMNTSSSCLIWSNWRIIIICCCFTICTSRSINSTFRTGCRNCGVLIRLCRIWVEKEWVNRRELGWNTPIKIRRTTYTIGLQIYTSTTPTTRDAKP